jgi:hypothetical protein
MNIMKGGAVLDLEPGDRQFKLQAVPARRPDTGIGLLAGWLAGMFMIGSQRCTLPRIFCLAQPLRQRAR